MSRFGLEHAPKVLQSYDRSSNCNPLVFLGLQPTQTEPLHNDKILCTWQLLPWASNAVCTRIGVQHSRYELQTKGIVFDIEAPWFGYPRIRGKRPTAEEFHEWALMSVDRDVQAMPEERLRLKWFTD